MHNKYYLAVEVTPKNYFPINLVDLNLSKYPLTNLNELDAFSLKYTKDELMKIINDANVVDINEDTALVVIYYENKDIRKIPALTKDISFDMWTYLKDNYSDKQFINKVNNFLKTKIENDLFYKLNSSASLEEWIGVINNLSYDVIRKLYFYLDEHRI